jgi:hypothetical protein
MSRTISPMSGKPYGLASVCRIWRVPRWGRRTIRSKSYSRADLCDRSAAVP